MPLLLSESYICVFDILVKGYEKPHRSKDQILRKAKWHNDTRRCYYEHLGRNSPHRQHPESYVEIQSISLIAPLIQRSLIATRGILITVPEYLNFELRRIKIGQITMTHFEILNFTRHCR